MLVAQSIGESRRLSLSISHVSSAVGRFFPADKGSGAYIGR
jgi:hypothetical protein